MTAIREVSIEDTMTQLAQMGEWVSAGRETVLGPHMLALADWVDSKVVEFAIQARARDLTVPSMIDRSILERAGYFESFPASMVEEFQGGCMPPATCYHCYAKLADTSLPETGVWTCITRCRRNEDNVEAGRMQTFTMREIVLVGPAAWVQERRQEWMDRVLAFAQSLHLVVQLDAATDSFFAGGQARGRKLLQQIKGLKFELRARMDSRSAALAISSFNLHETFFSRRFAFHLADSADAHTGCVAFGLERWALALAITLGPEQAFRLVEQEQQ